jgi:hypothetical protein
VIQQGFLIGSPQAWQVVTLLFWFGVAVAVIGWAALLIASRWSDDTILAFLRRRKRLVIALALFAFLLIGIQRAALAFPQAGGCSVDDPPYWYRCFVCGECWP